MTENQDNLTSIANLDPGKFVGEHREPISTGMHFVADWIPLGMGLPVEFLAQHLDADITHEGLTKQWGAHLAAVLNVDKEMLEGDAGVALVSEHIDDPQMPEWLRSEWKAAEEYGEHTGSFLASAGTQIGVMGFIAGIPGMIAGMFTSQIAKAGYDEMAGLQENVTVSKISGMMQQMMGEQQRQIEAGELDAKAYRMDKSLVAALLIARHPEQYPGENQNGELLEMVQQHIEDKMADPEAVTHLDGYVASLKDGGATFASELSAGFVGQFPPQTTALDIVAANINSEKDLHMLLFHGDSPGEFERYLSEKIQSQQYARAQAVQQEGRALHQAMTTPASIPAADLPSPGKIQQPGGQMSV